MKLAGADILTNSRIGTFRDCARKHQWMYEEGIRPKRQADYFRIGGMVHKALELDALGMAEAEIVATIRDNYAVVPEWCITEEQLHEWRVEEETVIVLCLMYWWYWNRDDVPAEVRIARYILTEQTVEFAIEGTRLFRYGGKVDGIVEMGDGTIACVEHKTTGESIEPGSDYWPRLLIDHQISGYMKGSKKHKPGDVLYDALRKPTIRPKQIPELDESGLKIVVDEQGERVRNERGGTWRQSADTSKGYRLVSRVETPEEFAERLRDDIAMRPDWYFVRRRIPRLDMDIAEFDADTEQNARMIRHCQKNGLWPRNSRSCLMRGKCAYFDLCANGVKPTDGVPAGFERVKDIHPELQGDEE